MGRNKKTGGVDCLRPESASLTALPQFGIDRLYIRVTKTELEMGKLIQDIVNTVTSERAIQRMMNNWNVSDNEIYGSQIRARSKLWRRCINKCNGFMLHPHCQIPSITRGFNTCGLSCEEQSPLKLQVIGGNDSFIFATQGNKVTGSIYADGICEPVELKMNSADVVELTEYFDKRIPFIDEIVFEVFQEKKKQEIIFQIEEITYGKCKR